MAVKPANVMAQDLGTFLEKVEIAKQQIAAMKARLESDPEFQKLWEADSAKALIEMGIDPEARQEVGYPAYIMGPECNYCITPKGNACHC